MFAVSPKLNCSPETQIGPFCCVVTPKVAVKYHTEFAKISSNPRPALSLALWDLERKD